MGTRIGKGMGTGTGSTAAPGSRAPARTRALTAGKRVGNRRTASRFLALLHGPVREAGHLQGT